MKVSVIVPAWGETPRLNDALASIRAQTYPDVELVVAAPPPDGPQTLPAARQEGLARATGELVTFCDADDWMDRETIERMAQAMTDDVDVVCCAETEDGDWAGECEATEAGEMLLLFDGAKPIAVRLINGSWVAE